MVESEKGKRKNMENSRGRLPHKATTNTGSRLIKKEIVKERRRGHHQIYVEANATNCTIQTLPTPVLCPM